MKHTAAFIIILSMAFTAACLRRQTVDQSIRAIERPEVEITRSGAPLIRSAHCDIIMEPVEPALWGALLSSAAYTRPPDRSMERRLPSLTFVHVILRNTSAAPLAITAALVRCGSRVLPSLSARDLGALLASPAYSAINFEALLSFRRLLEDRDSAARIDYDTDTIKSLLPFVPPDDTAVTLLAFDRIPPDVRTWRVSLTVQSGRNIKTIDFDFQRHEGRGEGDGGREKKTMKEIDHDH